MADDLGALMQSPDLTARITDAENQAWAQKLKFIQDQKLLGGLIDLGLMKRHQGIYPPARYPDHYGPDKPLMESR